MLASLLLFAKDCLNYLWSFGLPCEVTDYFSSSCKNAIGMSLEIGLNL